MSPPPPPPSADPLDYAAGANRARPPLAERLRRSPRAVALAGLVVISIVAAGLVHRARHRAWEGANTPAAREAAQRQAMLAFRLPADRVVYEEDRARAAQ